MKNNRHEILAVGEDARRMIGRTPGGIVAVRPLKDGVIADFSTTEIMLKYFMRKSLPQSIFKRSPRLVICVPCGITEVEKRAVEEAAKAAGARDVCLLEEPMAAAIGAGLDVYQAKGCMVVDVGGGTTEVAVISLGGIVLSRSIPMAGIMMDSVIVDFIKHDHNMLIGDRMAEDIKIDWGSALPVKEERKVMVRGRDLITGLPQTAEISSLRIYEALHGPCLKILDTIREVLDKTPPELCGDILRKGIYLVGGGAQLYGLDRFLASELNLPVTLAKYPMLSAATGVGHMADNSDLLPKLTRSNFMRDETN